MNRRSPCLLAIVLIAAAGAGHAAPRSDDNAPPMVGAPPSRVKQMAPSRPHRDATAMSPVVHQTTHQIMMPQNPAPAVVPPAGKVTKRDDPPN